MKISEIFNCEKWPLEKDIADARDRRTYWFIVMAPFALSIMAILMSYGDIHALTALRYFSFLWLFVVLLQRFYVKACMDTLWSDFEEKVSIRVREELARHGIGTADQEPSSGDAAQTEGESGD